MINSIIIAVCPVVPLASRTGPSTMDVLEVGLLAAPSDVDLAVLPQLHFDETAIPNPTGTHGARPPLPSPDGPFR